MHTERERPERRASSLTRGGSRSRAGKPPAKPVDTIFSAPYVPSSAAPSAAEPVRTGAQKPGRQVAALLGGLRKSG